MKDPALAQIGARMRQLRTSLRLTQAEVAEAAGIEPSFYGQLERGTNTPSVKTLMAVAEALHVAAADLLPSPNHPIGQRYTSVIEGMLSKLPDRDQRLVVGMVSDLVARLKK